MIGLGALGQTLDSFRFHVRQRSTGPWVRLYGELDLASAPELEALLYSLEESDATRIVLDLSELTFMDSAGLHVIVQAEQRADASQRRLIVRNPSRQVARLLELFGVAGRFH